MTELVKLAEKFQVPQNLISDFNQENPSPLIEALEARIATRFDELETGYKSKLEKIKDDESKRVAKSTHSAYGEIIKNDFGFIMPSLPDDLNEYEKLRLIAKKTQEFYSAEANKDVHFKALKTEAEKYKAEAEALILRQPEIIEQVKKEKDKELAEERLKNQKLLIVMQADPLIESMRNDYIMPTSPEVLQRRFANVRNEISNISFRKLENGTNYIVDEKDELIKDSLKNPITFESYVRKIMSLEFDVKQSDGTSTTPAAQDPQRPQQQQAATVGEPKTAEDYLKFISNKDHSVKDRMEYMNKYAAKFG